MGGNYYFQHIINEDIQEYCKKLSDFYPILNVEEFNTNIHQALKLHICKIGSGNKVCFQQTKYYKTMDEVTQFYIDYEYEYVVIDEYGIKIEFLELMKKIDIHIKLNTHIKHMGAFYPDTFYNDNNGYLFSMGEFN